VSTRRTELRRLAEFRTAAKWVESLNAERFVRLKIDVTAALSLERLLWPDFVEKRGCVILADRYEDA